MLKRLLDRLRQPLGLVGVGIAFLVVFSIAAYGLNLTQQSPEQPIEFPHNRHVGLGIQCLYCHPGALRGPSPGLPTVTKCLGCHQQMAITDTSEHLELLRAARKAVENHEPIEPIEWVPVAQVPDFVHFVHRPHIAGGLNCENCHGDLGKMTVYENPQVMNMGWCLTCHKARSESDAELRARLVDCGTCHY